jgi:hypothetical protein
LFYFVYHREIFSSSCSQASRSGIFNANNFLNDLLQKEEK